MNTAIRGSSGGHILHNLLLFGRVLRELGLDVHTGRLLDAIKALDHTGIRRRRDFKAALRTVLVHRQQDLSLFDEAFEVFWRPPKDQSFTMDLRALGEQRRYRKSQVAPPGPAADDQPAADHDDQTDDTDRVDLTRTYSAREVLRQKDFASYSLEEIGQANRMMAQLKWDLGMRRTRRWRLGHGPRVDLRRVVRRSIQYGGEFVELPRLGPKQKRRPLVLICDVSGSMEQYTRMLLHFIHSISDGMKGVEAFLFATRLTRITPMIPHRRVDEAVAAVSRGVPDWAGGTRIGEALKTFNYRWARRTLGWGAVVMIISDGWDRGDPELLTSEVARLQRSCYRLIWLNPLLGTQGYEPLTRGIMAALPLVDDHLPVHNLASLEDLASHLNSLPLHRPPRRQLTAYVPGQDTMSASLTRDGPRSSPQFAAEPTFRHPSWGRDGDGAGPRG